MGCFQIFLVSVAKSKINRQGVHSSVASSFVSMLKKARVPGELTPEVCAFM